MKKRAWVIIASLLILLTGWLIFYYTIGRDLMGIRKNDFSVSTFLGPSFYKEPLDIYFVQGSDSTHFEIKKAISTTLPDWHGDDHLSFHYKGQYARSANGSFRSADWHKLWAYIEFSEVRDSFYLYWYFTTKWEKLEGKTGFKLDPGSE